MLFTTCNGHAFIRYQTFDFDTGRTSCLCLSWRVIIGFSVDFRKLHFVNKCSSNPIQNCYVWFDQITPNGHQHWKKSLNTLFCKIFTEFYWLCRWFSSRNANEAVTTRIDVLTTVFEKYLWFKMTDQVGHTFLFQKKVKHKSSFTQVTAIGQIILDALENLIHIDLNALTEDEFLSKHALMKQNAVKSIFKHFLSDHSIDSAIAIHCYKIIQTVTLPSIEKTAVFDFVFRSMNKIVLISHRFNQFINHWLKSFSNKCFYFLKIIFPIHV